MEIIDELEKEKRGPYGGCVGYFSADGEMDTCIVLRTALVKDGVHATCRPAPASSPTATPRPSSRVRHKARALFQAAEEAVRFAGRSRRGNR